MPRRVTVAEVRAAVENIKTRSAWDRGVKAAALDMMDEMADWADWDTANKPGAGLCNGVIRCQTKAELVEVLKNGAETWKQASWGGNGLIYDEEIAKRYCSPSELKKTRNGERRPNRCEDWLDVQARGMNQAANKIVDAWWNLANGEG